MITWYAQEQDMSCVAACIRIVLSSFGQQLSEKRIRKVLGNPLYGLSLPQSYQRLMQAGLKITFHDDWGLIDLRDCVRDGWYPIVGIERRFFGHTDSTHAVVLIEIDSNAIRALDPLGNSSPEIYSPETFESAWSGAGQQALLIKSPLPL